MCTAVSLHDRGHFFGRTLDYRHSFGESIVVTPRKFSFPYRCFPADGDHYAILGTARLTDGYPLYFDAVNEKGVAMAGLNFPDHAVYHPFREGKINVTPYELLPLLLGTSRTAEEARELLPDISLLDRAFSEELPLTPMHWIVSDGKDCFVIEPMADGLQISDDPAGVLTNSPPFPEQIRQLMETPDVPGDWSSSSRFVRAAYMREMSVPEETAAGERNRLFRILGAVERTKGCTAADDPDTVTQYTVGYDAERGIGYWTTYGNRTLTAVDLHRENTDGDAPVSYPMITEPQILLRNG
ncbi:MAG: linear amide C-N hydrolase [Clostridia bacterium]|nr:linear amide C-N hydrolase [Clostridia bacterium]